LKSKSRSIAIISPVSFVLKTSIKVLAAGDSPLGTFEVEGGEIVPGARFDVSGARREPSLPGIAAELVLS
jgi:hypothetical protein